MKTGIHTLKELAIGDIVVVERYHTGTQLADYWYKRPWKVEAIYIGSRGPSGLLIGLNKNKTDETVGYTKVITEKMLEYAKLYKLSTKEELENWINSQRYN